MIIYRCDSLDADDADDADSFSLLTDYPLSNDYKSATSASSASKELNFYLSSALEHPRHVALVVLLAQGLALVILLLALGQGHHQLGQPLLVDEEADGMFFTHNSPLAK